MSTNHTPNYGLSQWECTDKVQMDDFNADNTKIDGALGTLATAMAGKGNCRIEHFELKEPPKVGIVQKFSAQPVGFLLGNGSFIGLWIKGMDVGVNVCFSSVHSAALGGFTVNWKGTSMTIPSLLNNSDTATYTYWMIAFFAQDKEN